uniref:Selenoprotein W n=1 Tax=Nothoprocta perdicaria TaxID=30464 RepID=A0A8C6Z384_NOTPE
PLLRLRRAPCGAGSFLLLRSRRQLKKALEKRFPGRLDMSGQGTREVTGWFEVTVGGRLVHSKKNGDGFVDTDAKLQRIVAAIEAALA